MEIDDIEKHYEIFDRLVKLFPVVESALKDENISLKILSEELDNFYSTVE